MLKRRITMTRSDRILIFTVAIILAALFDYRLYQEWRDSQQHVVWVDGKGRERRLDGEHWVERVLR